MTSFLAGNLGLGTLSGLTLVEPLAAEYMRQPMTFTSFPGSVGSNDSAANFGLVITPWGMLTAWALFDGGGNQVIGGALSTPINAAPGQIVTVMAGSISISFSWSAPSSSNSLTDYDGNPLTDYLGNPITTS
jgi:hypothetical protein